MGIRYQKRFNLGKGTGMNLSKSGVSFSQRTKYGSVGTKGWSLRTGIPGLSFRHRWVKKGANGLLILATLGLLTLGFLIIYNITTLLWHLLASVFGWVRRKVSH